MERNHKIQSSYELCVSQGDLREQLMSCLLFQRGGLWAPSFLPQPSEKGKGGHFFLTSLGMCQGHPLGWAVLPALTLCHIIPKTTCQELLDEAEIACCKLSPKFNHSWGNVQKKEMKLLSRRVIYLLIVWGTKYCEKENRVCKVF